MSEARLEISGNPGLMPDCYRYNFAVLLAAVWKEGQASCG
jgi:hypothetical protein